MTTTRIKEKKSFRVVILKYAMQIYSALYLTNSQFSHDKKKKNNF